MLYILISKKENYKDGAELIRSACFKFGIKSKIVDIKKIAVDKLLLNSKIYFLTNNENVDTLAKKLIKKGLHVINGDFLIQGYNKSAVQRIALNSGIKIPKIFSLNQIKFPCLVKSESHGKKNYLVSNRADISHLRKNNLISNNNYFEELIYGSDKSLIKVYWTKSRSFVKKHKIDSTIRQTIDDIARIFNFDVVSVDLFISKKNCWCIDINPAPALFGSSKARNLFVTSLFSDLDK